MKTVFADVKLWVLGRSEPLPLVLQSMMSGITCQLITKTGRAFFTPYLHTKKLQVALYPQYFKTNLPQKRGNTWFEQTAAGESLISVDV